MTFILKCTLYNFRVNKTGCSISKKLNIVLPSIIYTLQFFFFCITKTVNVTFSNHFIFPTPILFLGHCVPTPIHSLGLLFLKVYCIIALKSFVKFKYCFQVTIVEIFCIVVHFYV